MANFMCMRSSRITMALHECDHEVHRATALPPQCTLLLSLYTGLLPDCQRKTAKTHSAISNKKDILWGQSCCYIKIRLTRFRFMYSIGQYHHNITLTQHNIIYNYFSIFLTIFFIATHRNIQKNREQWDNHYISFNLPLYLTH